MPPPFSHPPPGTRPAAAPRRSAPLLGRGGARDASRFLNYVATAATISADVSQGAPGSAGARDGRRIAAESRRGISPDAPIGKTRRAGGEARAEKAVREFFNRSIREKEIPLGVQAFHRFRFLLHPALTTHRGDERLFRSTSTIAKRLGE